MPTPKTKWLKCAKIALVALVAMTFLAVTCFGAYITIAEREYYVPLVDFQAEIERTTFSLTPAIYDHINTQTTDFASIGNTTSTIKRTNWDIHDPSTTTVYKAWRDVSYRLGLDLARNVDSFEMQITTEMGCFNFTSYEIPAILVPNGYTAEIDVQYSFFYADGERHSIAFEDVQYTQAYRSGDVIELMRPYTIRNDVQYDIIGNVIINDYTATINFIKDDISLGYSGYYTFNGILGSLPEVVYYYVTVDGDYWWNTQDNRYFQVVGTRGDGSSVTLECSSIYFQNSEFIEMWYQIPDLMDGDILVYNYDDDEWLYAETGDLSDTESPEYISLDEIQVRQLYFEYDVDDTFEVDRADHVAMLNWFVSNTTYSSTSQVLDTPTPYGFTSDDGGIYVRYVVLPADHDISFQYLRGSWLSGYTTGFYSGNNADVNVDYVSWAVASIGQALSVEIFPGFTLGGMIAIIVAIPLAIIFLKLFAGG